MRPIKNTVRVLQAGFGLAEIMVGLAIGMIATLVIVQVATTFEAQKRTTTGTADAQTNGSIALYTIQRQAQMAGFGLPIFSQKNSPLHCNPSPTFDHDGNPATAAIGIFPVSIATVGSDDVITIRSAPVPIAGSSLAVSNGGTPIKITAFNTASNVASVANNLACQIGDIAIASNGAACTMTKVTALSAAPDYTQITLQTAPAAGTAVNASLACMGGWTETVYRVNNGNMEENGAPSVAGIVTIQAQYGISATADNNQVTQWVDPTGATWATPTVADRNRIKAIRVVIVARNGLLEKNIVTSACSSLTADTPTGLCAWAGSVDSPAPAIDLSSDPNWQYYRYRVFETIIPLRNMIWSKDVL
ncbi:MAG TPA: PilW family protein [Candidatus Saccharimonadales bacterium]|nr:PilW family protein [Candidatus Saccharimonadales bacterium]